MTQPLFDVPEQGTCPACGVQMQARNMRRHHQPGDDGGCDSVRVWRGYATTAARLGDTRIWVWATTQLRCAAAYQQTLR